MSDAMMWFGTAEYAQWVPAPDSGMQRSRVGSSASHTSDNGGQVIVRSSAHHNDFEMQWSSLSSHGVSSLSTFVDYASGVYGNGYLYFTDPMTRLQNVMPTSWGSPGLSNGDWKPIVDGKVSYIPTPLLLPGYPLVSMVADESIFGSFGSVLENTQVTVLIPPGYRLKVAVLGGTTLNDGQAPSLYAETRQNLTGVYLSGRNIGVTPLGQSLQFYDVAGTQELFSLGAVTRMRLSMPQGTYITGIMAQVVAPGEVAGVAIESDFGGLRQFIPGRGSSGCMFADEDATPETYILGNGDRSISTLGTTLGEVEQWTRRNALT